MVRWERPLSRPCGPCGVAFGQPGQRPLPVRFWRLWKQARNAKPVPGWPGGTPFPSVAS